MSHPSPLSIAELQQACLTLEVFVGSKPVGVIEKSGNYFVFQYYPGVEKSDFVSLLMPVRATPYSPLRPQALPAVFDMNLPEGGLRRILIDRYGKLVQGFNDLALLALVGQNTIGRLTFGAPKPAQSITSQTLDVEALMQSEDADALLAHLYRGDTVLSGIAGAQPKVIASISPEAIVKFSDHDAPGQDMRTTFLTDNLIVKASAGDTPWLAANEFYCLRAAALSGLAVPETRLFQNGQVLLVSRFDHVQDASGQRIAYGAEDFCALNAMVAAEKYSSAYERVGKTLAAFVSPDHLSDDLQRLFHSITLSCVVRNGDAHLKNFTVLYDPRDDFDTETVAARLSPAYDICCTNAYIPQDLLALTLAGSKRYPNRKKLELFARQHCRLLPATIETIFDQVEDGVNAAAHELRGYGEQNPGFAVGVGERMLACWDAGLQSIDRNLSVPVPNSAPRPRG